MQMQCNNILYLYIFIPHTVDTQVDISEALSTLEATEKVTTLGQQPP